MGSDERTPTVYDEVVNRLDIEFSVDDVDGTVTANAKVLSGLAPVGRGRDEGQAVAALLARIIANAGLLPVCRYYETVHKKLTDC